MRSARALLAQLECSGRCRCGPLAARLAQVERRNRQANEATKAKKCRRQRRAARRAARKLETQLAKQVRRGCVAPPETVAALEAAVAALRASIDAQLAADVCGAPPSTTTSSTASTFSTT